MKEKEEKANNILALVQSCEELCDILRGIRQHDPNKFFDSPEEKLLKNMDSTLTAFYRGQVDEPREVMKLKLEQRRLYTQINELERELAARDYEDKKKETKQ